MKESVWRQFVLLLERLEVCVSLKKSALLTKDNIYPTLWVPLFELVSFILLSLLVTLWWYPC